MIDDDSLQVRRASRAIGFYVAFASAIIISSGVGVLVTIILFTSRREGMEHVSGAGSGRGDELVVDVDQVLPAVVLLGVLGVAVLGFVAWLAARRSVRPLEAALRLQRNFVADASHELRTPLTTLSSRIQVLQRRHQRGERIDASITELRRDAAMMNDVLDDLLLTAEAGASTASEPSDVLAAIENAVTAVGAVADDAQVSIRIESPPDLVVKLPPVTLVRVVLALVDNAVQHSPSGSTVTISALRAGHAAAIRVTDRGTGVTGIARERVFDRFARSTENGRRRGFGLGLSLVRDVAIRAGGSIEVEDTSPAGTTFLLRLPLAD